jgi:hypothetical protein
MDIKPLTYADEFFQTKESVVREGGLGSNKRRRTSSGPVSVSVARKVADIEAAEVSQLLKVYWLR